MPFWAPLNTVQPSAVLASRRDDTDVEIGLPATLDPACRGVQANSLHGWRTWVTGGCRLLSSFLSSQEVAMVEGMGLLVLKQNQQQFIDPFLCGEVSWVLPVILPALTLKWIVCVCSVVSNSF